MKTLLALIIMLSASAASAEVTPEQWVIVGRCKEKVLDAAAQTGNLFCAEGRWRGNGFKSEDRCWNKAKDEANAIVRDCIASNGRGYLD